MDFSNGAWNTYQYVTLNLNIPIFTGFGTYNRYRSSTLNARIAQQQYEDAVRQSKNTDDLIVVTYQNSLNTAAVSENNFTLYARSLELTRKKFTEGLISIDVYQRAFEDYLHAENAHINNIATVYNAAAPFLARRP